MNNETLIAENVEIDLETLADTQSSIRNLYILTNARCKVVEAVLNALSPEDRKKLEAYIKGE